MSNRLPVPRRRTLERIIGQLKDFRPGEDTTVVLEIVADDHDLRIRDLASFLNVIDSAFGRVDPAGYLSYAHRPDDQLRITAIKEGSTKYEIAVVLLDYLQAWQTLVTYAVVVALPSVVSGKAAKNWAEAYRAFGEGRAVWRGARDQAQLGREQKSVIREVIRSDEVLSALSKEDGKRLAQAVEHVLAMEETEVRRAARFSRKHVRSVAMRVIGPGKDG